MKSWIVAGLVAAQGCACAFAKTSSIPAAPAVVNAPDVNASCAALVHANYEDGLATAREMQKSIAAFTAAPNAETLVAARKAWLPAREFYGQTEVFRLYGGPIDDDKGPEGRLNAWPMDEAYVDAVKGKATAGLVNNRKVKLDKKTLSAMNERGGEENIATGWRAIGFKLWGQDLSDTGPDNRSFEEFVDGKARNADRQRHSRTTRRLRQVWGRTGWPRCWFRRIPGARRLAPGLAPAVWRRPRQNPWALLGSGRHLWYSLRRARKSRMATAWADVGSVGTASPAVEGAR
jgi:uncharacterized iron-regulated protein